MFLILAYFFSGFSHIAIGGLERLVRDFKEKTKGRVRIYNNNANEKDGRRLPSVRLVNSTLQLTALKAYSERIYGSINLLSRK